MQDAVGGAAEDHGEDEGVFEGGAGEEVARTDVELHTGADSGGSALALAELLGRGGREGGGAGEGEAHGFDGCGHGVGRVHAAAGPSTGARVLLDVGHDLVLRGAGALGVGGLEPAVGVGAGGFVAGRDVDLLVEDGRVALADGAAVDHDEGPVVARGGHDNAGHVLVAAGDADVGVVVLRAGHGLDAVGDDLARLEGVAHACFASQTNRPWSCVRGMRGSPSPPMVIASETPTVLNCHASIFSFSTAFLTSVPSSSTAQGLDPFYPTLKTPSHHSQCVLQVVSHILTF